MFSVGVLYSCHDFLDLVRQTPLYSESFPLLFQRFEVATGESVLKTSQACEWTLLSSDGGIHISKRGEDILALGSPEARLRLQLKHMIMGLRPNWTAQLSYGRVEATKSLPEDARQCFEEAGLLNGYDASTVEWWDTVASSARVVKDGGGNSGRLAEQYSRAYEHDRVGMEPYWEGFESNFAGYDLLSRIDRDSDRRLLIEVKSTQNRVREGSFFVSRNEWKTAIHSTNYVFHLWAMKPLPKLFVVAKEDLSHHIPSDRGKGMWKEAWVPMSSFSHHEVSVKSEILESVQ